MLDKIYFNLGHLTPISFLMLESEVLSVQEKQLMLSHIGDCDLCMEKYLASLTEDSLLTPSEGLSDMIMQNVGQIKEEMKQKSIKTIFMQFAKLSVAVCLMMGIFFSGALGFKVNDIPKRSEDGNYSQQLQSAAQAYKKPEEKRKPSFFDGLLDSFNSGFTGLADQINLGYKGDALNATK